MKSEFPFYVTVKIDRPVKTDAGTEYRNARTLAIGFGALEQAEEAAFQAEAFLENKRNRSMSDGSRTS